MTKKEEFKVSGEGILNKVKELINEGNIRRITIKSKDGKVIAEFPLTIGLIGTALIPTFAAIGTIVALVTECTIAVERETPTQDGEEEVSEDSITITDQQEPITERKDEE